MNHILPRKQQKLFQTGKALTITGGHFVHDTFSAFLAPLLPLIIENLSLSLTMAGTLSAMIQIPSILNPFIGYLDEKKNLRKLMFFAPAIDRHVDLRDRTGSQLAPFGIHFIPSRSQQRPFPRPGACAFMARISGGQLGMGMSYFMAGGEAGRTLGPLIAVSLVSLLTLEGILPVALVGWGIHSAFSSVFDIQPPDLQKCWLSSRSFRNSEGYFLPIFLLSLSRGFIITSLGVYLPTLLKSEGANLWAAGTSLAIYQFAGVIGALSSGNLE